MKWGLLQGVSFRVDTYLPFYAVVALQRRFMQLTAWGCSEFVSTYLLFWPNNLWDGYCCHPHLRDKGEGWGRLRNLYELKCYLWDSQGLNPHRFFCCCFLVCCFFSFFFFWEFTCEFSFLCHDFYPASTAHINGMNRALLTLAFLPRKVGFKIGKFLFSQ